MIKPFRKIRQFLVNKATGPDQVMVQCRTVINKSAVSRQSIDGVEHIVVSSATLPDDIVMNGVLYPAEVIKNTFEDFENTLAPVEHPVDGQGNFILAASPQAIHNFHAGAFNKNVRQEDGRVHIDKFINVMEANKSERGRHLLDRINELETNANPRPIHTSIAALAVVEDTDKVLTNSEGQEYTRIVKELFPDHDAILLDSVGAAQPDQGVGMAVNKAGDEMKVERCQLNEDQSFSERHIAVMDALEKAAIDADWIEELFEDKVIFWNKDDLFEVPYVVDDDGIATIVGIPLPVERKVTFEPKTNSEGDPMKELILNALKKAGIETEGKSDDELFKAYNQLQANESDDDGDGNDNENGDMASVVANAVEVGQKPLLDRLDSIEANQAAADTAEVDSLAEIVGNSDKYQGIDAESAKKLGLEKLKEMAAICVPSYGLNPVMNTTSGNDEANLAPVDMVA